MIRIVLGRERPKDVGDGSVRVFDSQSSFRPKRYAATRCPTVPFELCVEASWSEGASRDWESAQLEPKGAYAAHSGQLATQRHPPCSRRTPVRAVPRRPPLHSNEGALASECRRKNDEGLCLPRGLVPSAGPRLRHNSCRTLARLYYSPTRG